VPFLPRSSSLQQHFAHASSCCSSCFLILVPFPWQAAAGPREAHCACCAQAQRSSFNPLEQLGSLLCLSCGGTLSRAQSLLLGFCASFLSLTLIVTHKMVSGFPVASANSIMSAYAVQSPHNDQDQCRCVGMKSTLRCQGCARAVRLSLVVIQGRAARGGAMRSTEYLLNAAQNQAAFLQKLVACNM
jgi:hypothetical protein